MTGDSGDSTNGSAPRRGEPNVVRLPRRHNDGAPDIELHQRVQGSKPGGGFVRLTRPGQQKLRRVAEGEFEATRNVLRPATRLGRGWAGMRGLLIGEPLASSELSHERLGKLKALAIFSSDALSSAAYATEEILLILILAGTGAMTRSIPISLAIALLAGIVVVSYRQTIRAYPNGGGAYIVANENLGLKYGLVAGAALIVDYIMTVAVSTAAGVAAITSAVPGLHSVRIELALASIALITLGNLRGIRESGTIFAIPTYFFIFSFGGMIVVGFVRLALGQDLQAPIPAHAVDPGVQALSLFLLLRAFSSGSAALTGIEAVANGVPSFKPPESRNAATTQTWMAIILTFFFVGTTVLAHELKVVPADVGSGGPTVVSQIAQTVFGKNVIFYAVQVGTMFILMLAANTAFAGLPTLTSVMAKDKVMPSQFAFRGDRLAFSNGIIVLGLASALILFLFKADTNKIIPLYAFGVFTAFTLSQAGMVVHWRRTRGPGWRKALIVNAVGAIATGIVAVIVLATKFTHGAWLSIAIMVVLVLLLWRIRTHYDHAAEQLGEGLDAGGRAAREFYGAATRRTMQTVLVPVDQINLAVLRTIAYARSISPNTVAIHVSDDREEAERLRQEWEESVPDVSLQIVESPYRSIVEPVLAYVDALDRSQPGQVITVVLPEFITRSYWHRFLHNQLSLRLKHALINRPNTVIVDVPYHLMQ